MGDTKGTYPIEADNIIVALFGVELDGESTRIAGFIWEFAAKRHGRETNEDGCLFSDSGKEVGFLGREAVRKRKSGDRQFISTVRSETS